MKKKLQLKGFTAGFTSAIMIMVLSLSLFAATESNIKVTYNGIKLIVDGVAVVFGNDSSGKKIEPFIYNGTTYLPVRAVGTAIGKTVDWDGATQTVYVGPKPGSTLYLNDVVPPYSSQSTNYTSNDGKAFYMANVAYNNGMVFNKFSGSGTKTYYNLNSKFKEIEFTYGALQEETESSTGYIKVYLDGKLSNTYEIKVSKLPETVKLDISNVNQIYFEHAGNYTTPNACVGNIIVR